MDNMETGIVDNLIKENEDIQKEDNEEEKDLNKKQESEEIQNSVKILPSQAFCFNTSKKAVLF